MLLLLLILCMQVSILAAIIQYLQHREQAARVSLACMRSRPAPRRLAAQPELPPKLCPRRAHVGAAQQGSGDRDASARGRGGVEQQEGPRKQQPRRQQQRQPPLMLPHAADSCRRQRQPDKR